MQGTQWGEVGNTNSCSSLFLGQYTYLQVVGAHCLILLKNFILAVAVVVVETGKTVVLQRRLDYEKEKRRLYKKRCQYRDACSGYDFFPH